MVDLRILRILSDIRPAGLANAVFDALHEASDVHATDTVMKTIWQELRCCHASIYKISQGAAARNAETPCRPALRDSGRIAGFLDESSPRFRPQKMTGLS